MRRLVHYAAAEQLFCKDQTFRATYPNDRNRPVLQSGRDRRYRIVQHTLTSEMFMVQFTIFF